MNYLRRNWYNIGGIVAIGTIIYLIFAWHYMVILQRLLLLNFVALLIHQFEEYGFPGGEPAILNMVLVSEPSSNPNRFPLNQNSAMIVNVVIAYTMYLIPIFLPYVIWLGLAPILFGMAQFIVHGIIINRRLKSFYNPGLGAVVLLHIPIGIYYIYYIQSTGIASGWNWIIGIVYAFLTAFIFLDKIVHSWLADKNSPYAFTEDEMRRFNVQEKLKKLSEKSR